MAIAKREYKQLQDGDKLLCVKSSNGQDETKFTKGNIYNVKQSPLGMYVVDDNNVIWVSHATMSNYLTLDLDYFKSSLEKSTNKHITVVY